MNESHTCASYGVWERESVRVRVRVRQVWRSHKYRDVTYESFH